MMQKNIQRIFPAAMLFLFLFIYRFSFRTDFKVVELLQIISNSIADLIVIYLVMFIGSKSAQFLPKTKPKAASTLLRIAVFIGLYFAGIQLLQKLHYFVHLSTTGMSDKFQATFARTSYQIFDSYLVLAFGIVLLLGWHYYNLSIRAKADKELADRERVNAELKFLKAQINPHFIFNTLNNVNFLIDEKNERARSLMQDFCDLLRYQLYETGSELVPLYKEITYLENYIRIQHVRKESGFTVSFDKKIDSEEVIAPMLLIVPLENAFKYSESSDQGFIKIHLEIDEQHKLTFTVTNTVLPHYINKTHLGGLGLENLRKRLGLIYKNQASFETSILDGQFTARLSIQL